MSYPLKTSQNNQLEWFQIIISESCHSPVMITLCHWSYYCFLCVEIMNSRSPNFWISLSCLIFASLMYISDRLVGLVCARTMRVYRCIQVHLQVDASECTLHVSSCVRWRTESTSAAQKAAYKIAFISLTVCFTLCVMWSTASVLSFPGTLGPCWFTSPATLYCLWQMLNS